ncbi:MAG: hypothetical protein WA871_10400 [Candidatus Acidiferrales bacterium]
MTTVEVTYQLQEPLADAQMLALGSFANTYGLRRFRASDDRRHLTFEYDASRLKPTEVVHVLSLAKIAIIGRVEMPDPAIAQ